jgi:hypothetical protein
MILIGKPARVILRFLEDAERLIAAFVPPKSGGTCLGAIAKEYDAPMTPRLDWLHYQVGTHQSDGTFHAEEQPGEKDFLCHSHRAAISV